MRRSGRYWEQPSKYHVSAEYALRYALLSVGELLRGLALLRVIRTRFCNRCGAYETSEAIVRSKLSFVNMYSIPLDRSDEIKVWGAGGPGHLELITRPWRPLVHVLAAAENGENQNEISSSICKRDPAARFLVIRISEFPPARSFVQRLSCIYSKSLLVERRSFQSRPRRVLPVAGRC